jgi:hypothetical protein
MVETFADGDKLLRACAEHRLEDVVSKKRVAPYLRGQHGMAEDQVSGLARCEPGSMGAVAVS